MRPDIYHVANIGAGSLYVMPKPSSQWLHEDVSYFTNLGINLVVSHLEKAEEYELGLVNEAGTLESAGIEFLCFPVADRGLPELVSFRKFIESLYTQIVDGANVAVHCRAGIGRTGVTSACILIRDAYESQAAIDTVSAARGIQIPDTQEQYDFICDYL